jgi:hypothetical protein
VARVSEKKVLLVACASEKNVLRWRASEASAKDKLAAVAATQATFRLSLLHLFVILRSPKK